MQYNGKQKSDFCFFFWGQKRALVAPLELAQQHEQHENIVFLVSSHYGARVKVIDDKDGPIVVPLPN